MVDPPTIGAKPTQPKRRALARLSIPVVLLVCAVVVLTLAAIHFRWDPGPHDEGVRLYGAEQLLDGMMPGRDFYFNYVVGQLAVVAVAFSVGGVGVLPFRSMLFVMFVAKLAVLALLGLGLSRGRVGFVMAVVAGIMLWEVGYNLNEPTLVWLLVSMLLLWRWGSVGGWGWLCLAAGVHALVGLFRWDWWLASMPGAAAWCLLSPGPVAAGALIRRRLVYAAVFSLTTLAVCVGAMWLAYGGLTGFYHNTVVASLDMIQASSLPVPKPPPPNPFVLLRGEISLAAWVEILWIRVLFYAPALVMLGSLGLAWLLKSTSISRLFLSRLALPVLVALPFYVYASGRSDATHSLVLVQLILPLTAGVWHVGAAINSRLGRWLVRASVAVLWGLFVSWPLYNEPGRHGVPRREFTVDRAKGMLGPIQEVQDYEQSIRCVRQLTNRPIFVGSGRHDAVRVNDVLFYFLSQRPSATRWHQLNPGLTDTLSVQERIIADIEMQNVEVLVQWTHAESNEPNRSRWGTGEQTLDRFFHSHFALYKQFGRRQVWTRRSRGIEDR
jgi:hypothetical protein